MESPVPGSGKDLLVAMCLRPSLGQQLGFIAQARDEDEWRKRITASLLEGQRAILIGNLSKTLESGTLANALTALYWSDRLLGKNQMVNLPVRCVWVTTGNNPTVSTEIARRAIRIRIDPRCPKPWERTEFKHPSLREWVDEHRSQLVWSALILAQHWVVKGQPLWQTRSLGSYEHWSAVIGGILEIHGIDGFLSNLDEFYQTADAEGAQWELFVELWWQRFSDEPARVGDLLPLALDTGIELKGEGNHARRVSLGMQINQHRDQVLGLYRIVLAGRVRGAAEWQLLATQSSLPLVAASETSETSESFLTPNENSGSI